LNTRRWDLKARRKWRLYADNNIEKEIAHYLKEQAGFDVLTVCDDPKLQHRDDEFHYERARQLGRYLLTHDDDFWDDRRFPLRQSPGVIIIPKNEEGMTRLFPVLLRKIIERDYNIDNGPRHLGGTKVRMTWDGMTHKASLPDGSVQESATFSWIDLGYKRK
jgi:predicted nuclease of predicted toxin-antitoxin system